MELIGQGTLIMSIKKDELLKNNNNRCGYSPNFIVIVVW